MIEFTDADFVDELRQERVGRLKLAGKNNAEIAQELGISLELVDMTIQIMMITFLERNPEIRAELFWKEQARLRLVMKYAFDSWFKSCKETRIVTTEVIQPPPSKTHPSGASPKTKIKELRKPSSGDPKWLEMILKSSNLHMKAIFVDLSEPMHNKRLTKYYNASHISRGTAKQTPKSEREQQIEDENR